MCNTGDSYTYEYKYEGHFKGYEATIHSQVKLGKNYFSATDIAEISKIVVETAKDRFRGLESRRYDALQRMFSHTHVIVVVDNEHLYQVWGKEAGPSEQPLLARTTKSKYACWQAVNNTYFFTIVEKSFNNKLNADTVVHEMTHIAGRVLFDDYDVDHDSPLLWDEYDDRYSLQQMVEDRWSYRKGRKL